MYSAKFLVTSAALSLWAFSAGAVVIAPADAMSNALFPTAHANFRGIGEPDFLSSQGVADQEC